MTLLKIRMIRFDWADTLGFSLEYVMAKARTRVGKKAVDLPLVNLLVKARADLLLFFGWRAALEAHEFLDESERDTAGFAVAVLREDELGFAL
jgi:hypothetical protein